MILNFPDNFKWGAASAAHQIEGAYNVDGKSLGIWDALYEGNVKYNENGHTACDHYNRFKEDVAIMKEMGLNTYRFSISWPRVMPEKGKVNQAGLNFYKELINELLEAGIEPMVTLYHWNMPMWVYEEGGWKDSRIVENFADFVEVIVKEFSNKVSNWITLNEPACFIGNGYVTGNHAPFINSLENVNEIPELVSVLTKNVLLAHGRAVQVIREHAILLATIGISINGTLIEPKNHTEAEIEHAKNRMFDDYGLFATVSWWADPILKRRLPDLMKPLINETELDIISQPIDFLGFNSYTTSNYDEWTVDRDEIYPGMPRTSMGWTITPNALYWAAKLIFDRYDMPLMITENGMANIDFVSMDGNVYDPQRIDFLRGYLKGLQQATEEGVPVKGYLYWSIMDNFEWAEGYDPRFGLIYVDYQTQKRTRKESSYWYEKVIKSNSIEVPEINK